jgi:F0F1-type ATP synthase delta subunit
VRPSATNKLMLRQAIQASEENINSVIMKSKKLKASLASYSSSNDDKWRLFTKAISSPTTRTLLLCRETVFLAKDST